MCAVKIEKGRGGSARAHAKSAQTCPEMAGHVLDGGAWVR